MKIRPLKTSHIIRLAVTIVTLVPLLGINPVSAISQEDLDSINNFHPFYDPNASRACQGAAAAATLVGNDNITKIYNFLISGNAHDGNDASGLGLTPNQALGVLGNLHRESHFDPTINQNPHGDMPTPPSPQVHNDGYGIVQWQNGRQTSLLAYAAANNAAVGDLSLQLKYLKHEVVTSYSSAVLGPLLAATTSHGAADVWVAHYEIPSDIPGDEQINYANIVQDAKSLGIPIDADGNATGTATPTPIDTTPTSTPADTLTTGDSGTTTCAGGSVAGGGGGQIIKSADAPAYCQNGSALGNQKIVCSAWLFDSYGYDDPGCRGNPAPGSVWGAQCKGVKDLNTMIADVKYCDTNGFTDANCVYPKNWLLVDCSAMVDAALFDAVGVNMSGAATGSYPGNPHLQPIDPASAQPGDIAWWQTPDGHTEVIVSYDAAAQKFHTFGAHQDNANHDDDISPATYSLHGDSWSVQKVFRVVP